MVLVFCCLVNIFLCFILLILVQGAYLDFMISTLLHFFFTFSICFLLTLLFVIDNYFHLQTVLPKNQVISLRLSFLNLILENHILLTGVKNLS